MEWGYGSLPWATWAIKTSFGPEVGLVHLVLPRLVVHVRIEMCIGIGPL